MSVGAAAHDSTPLADQSVERALALLAEALEIVDALNVSPEIGARLQEVITALEVSARP